jgi:hypothetical protein
MLVSRISPRDLQTWRRLRLVCLSVASLGACYVILATFRGFGFVAIIRKAGANV